ncbi:hypothetical protein JX265_000856 [Neoarthrinium moseri]|uniref:Uncharacterized protein n=1 Tax=Neoarthrinium moseri TaxID=1658444 RepID=A0A9Q0AVC7_9PEZI|nr:uncharacterized protein JN550_007038 [Neoarthrinium moseri]KAI1867307.1 hypothetical protein JN550_007038 [Neoarthrinium moseri]KAI1880616.1 hypothetical protein JX265_000856 [Neoarthrinium moseri]
MPTLTHFRAALRGPVTSCMAAPLAARPFHSSAVSHRPYKDDQDRESLKPKAHEYTGSGEDDDMAANPDAAFNPNKTSPGAAKEAAGHGNDTNPLENSPANKDVAESGRGKEEDKTKAGAGKRSGGGSPAKNKPTQ